jgi:hypothetical protein
LKLRERVQAIRLSGNKDADDDIYIAWGLENNIFSPKEIKALCPQ